MVPGSLGCGVSVFPIAAMFAPSRAARSAMARPIPRLAPVMKRVLDARGVAIPRIIVAGLIRKKGARRQPRGQDKAPRVSYHPQRSWRDGHAEPRARGAHRAGGNQGE